jgi:hypothetical protein
MTGMTPSGALLPTFTTPIQNSPLSPVIDPEPLIRSGRNWTRWAGPIVSLLILVVALDQFRGLDFAHLWTLMPTGIAFWAAFLLYYTAAPISEWVIFRRLWNIPLDGFGALLRKLVSNEILLGYMGEVYFYAWARRHAQITTAPFGALKDVTILSALAGNVVTLLMVAAGTSSDRCCSCSARRWWRCCSASGCSRCRAPNFGA